MLDALLEVKTVVELHFNECMLCVDAQKLIRAKVEQAQPSIVVVGI